ncbi:MAG TPA: site-specific DNA-methyltransferase [Polyangiaceae bacterium]|nr:site-specific DNA-methyltransferase [Polyangiaceae bacterium]
MTDASSAVAPARFELSLSPNPRSSAPSMAPYSLFEADAVEWLRTLPDASVDLVVTDPPYESLEKHRAVGTTTRLKRSKSSSNDWFQIFPNARFPEFFGEVFRVLKKHRHFYLFCDPETMFVAKPLAEHAGFKFWKPLVWDKQKIGMGYHYRSRYELILFFEKGKRRIADLSIPDVLQHARVHGGYPAEKPVSVSEVLIRQSTSPADVVIDPFMGSGSAGVAAVSLGRRFMGTDVSKVALETTGRRLNELVSGDKPR